jgi:hypothetical protein
MKRAVLVVLAALAGAAAHAQGGLMRAPSAPLVVHDPYFSIWSAADKWTDAWPVHWTGRPHALSCLVRIDGKVMRVIGPAPSNVPAMQQVGVEVAPTRTISTFTAGTVLLNMIFTTPALPSDLALMSRPVTYVTLDFRAVDGKDHDIAFQFDTSTELCVDTVDTEVVFGRAEADGLAVMRCGSKAQPVLEKSGDDRRIDWGHAYLAVPHSEGARTRITSDTDARDSFAKGQEWRAEDDAESPRKANDRWPVLAARFDLGKVNNTPVRRRLMLAYDDEWSIRWMGTKLRPYWRTKFSSARELLEAAEREWPDIEKRCETFNAMLRRDLKARGGTVYARLASLAWRQTIGGNKLVADAEGRLLLFPKENTSNGCIGTVDVIYPMAPLFLFSGAELSKAMLTPVLEYGSSSAWPFPIAPHDLGTYPHADGQVYGGGAKSADNQMPVEESANLILLVAALTQIEDDAAFAQRYLPVLERWAKYLEEKGLDPENQLCTDDFAGHLAHNANLSIKAILALGAFGQLCTKLERAEDAARWRALAERFAAEWMQKAADGDHTRLAFDRAGTWSQKYNLAWDRVLGLNLFSDELKQSEMAWYKRVQNEFGLPLDSRADYTKLDWITWTATITNQRADFDALLAPVVAFLDKTPDRVPMSDWYDTKTARTKGMHSRPVVGGVFMWALGDRDLWKTWFSAAAKGQIPGEGKSARSK